jgi:hypothetical protein
MADGYKREGVFILFGTHEIIKTFHGGYWAGRGKQ